MIMLMEPKYPPSTRDLIRLVLKINNSDIKCTVSVFYINCLGNIFRMLPLDNVYIKKNQILIGKIDRARRELSLKRTNMFILYNDKDLSIVITSGISLQCR